MGRFAAAMLIAGLASPALATTPPEARKPVPSDFNLAPGAMFAASEPASGQYERTAFPTEQPRVPTNDALRPPDLLWQPTPASLVKVVPAKVRYRLKF